MRHLRYLTPLSLGNIVNSLRSAPSTDDDVDDGPISEDALKTQNPCQWGSNYEQIWRTIRNVDLRLEEIKAYTIPSAFLEHTDSYSGLKKLDIRSGYYDNRLGLTVWATNFTRR